MTFLARRGTGRGLRAWLLVTLLLAAGMAGCIGSETEDDEQKSFRVFLAATGEAGDASAELSSVGVKRNDTGATQFLTLESTTFDLAQLAGSGQALLAATAIELNATVEKTIVVFSELTIDGTPQENVRLEVPLSYQAAPGVETTVTLDLAKSLEAEAPRLAHLVAERGGEQVASITGGELEAGQREEVQPLAEPTIVVQAAEGNDTAPSFQVNTELSFTVDIDERPGAEVREVFWSFSDGTTKAGREVTHAFRSAGPHTAGAIVEGTRGQQARDNTTLDIYFEAEGEGNIGVGTGGSGLLEDRDVKNHRIEVPGPATNMTVRFEQGTSAGEEGTPGNLQVELYDPAGDLAGANTNDTRVKFINVTATPDAPLEGGEWVLRVKGDVGAAIGYKFALEAHYLGLSPTA